MKVFAAVVMIFWSFLSLSALIEEKIFIIPDSLETSQGEKFPYVTYNSSRSFDQKNVRVEISVSDQLDLWIVNLDSVDHLFDIKGFNLSLSILAGDSVNYVNVFNEAGSFIFHDVVDFPKYSYLGLSGMLIVKDHTYQSFYWNIKDHNKDWNVDLFNNGNVTWEDYDPKFFTVNGNSHPNINSDTDARITGNVGDTLMIYITNTGKSIHPIHFHGYHVTVMESSKFPNQVGWSKDSQGVYPMESVVLRLVPNQPGEYPIHDHNLIATTGNNIYPYGLLSTILINP